MQGCSKRASFGRLRAEWCSLHREPHDTNTRIALCIFAGCRKQASFQNHTHMCACVHVYRVCVCACGSSATEAKSVREISVYSGSGARNNERGWWDGTRKTMHSHVIHSHVSLSFHFSRLHTVPYWGFDAPARTISSIVYCA